MKKLFASAFVVALLIAPAISRAGFFDFLKLSSWQNLSAQTRTAVSTSVEGKSEPLKRGDTNNEILYIQTLLAKQGYYDGKLSGTIGAKTQTAIKNWQTKNNLKPTGLLDETTSLSIAGIREEQPKEVRGGGFFLANIKMLLGGSYNSVTGLMSTALNDANLIPTMEPYSAMGYFLTEDGIEMDPGVLNATGPNAIVDWVVVELRDADHMQNTVYARAALLQADGDIVDMDGVSPIRIYDLPPESYYVLVAHRNHLPIITETPVDITGMLDMTTAALYYDISMPNTAAKIVNGKQVLWPGDINQDHFVIYTGGDNDRELILQAIGGVVPTNTVSGQYRAEDVNMDGVVKYTGANNDREIILQSIGGIVPTNILSAQLPEMYPVSIELVSTDAEVWSEPGFSDLGTYKIRFAVTPLEDNVVVPQASELLNSVHVTNEGAEYGTWANAGQGVTNLSAVLVDVTDSDLTSSGGYLVEEGETEEFELTVNFYPQADGFFKVYLNSFNWGFDSGPALNANKFYTIDLGHALGVSSNFTTGYIFLNAI